MDRRQFLEFAALGTASSLINWPALAQSKSNVLIAAEMMGANAGLGFLLYDAEVKYQIPVMYASIITMSLLGLVLNYMLVAFEKKITYGKEELSSQF